MKLTSRHNCFLVNIAKFLKNTYSEEYLGMAASEVSGEIAFALISLFM